MASVWAMISTWIRTPMSAFEKYGTTGLINNPDAVETTVAQGAAGDTAWAKKTPQEILKDINSAISAVWEAANNDESAMPNHILLPYAQYTYLLNTPVSAEIVTRTTILDYIMENNVATKAGKGFFIGGTNWCKGAGTGQKDRMVVYNNDRRFVNGRIGAADPCHDQPQRHRAVL